MHRLVAPMLLLGLALPTDAQETLFYKCTDARGNVSMQNGTPCAAGMKQEVRRIGEVRTVPVPAKRPDAPAPPPAPAYGDFVLVSGPNMQRAPAAEAAALPPPAALYHCRTWEGETYYGDVAEPPPRCAPLQVMGIDGSAALGAGLACEMKHDACSVVPDAQLCAAWYRRMDEAEFKWKYAARADEAARKAAFDAIDAAIKASSCSPVAPLEAQNP